MAADFIDSRTALVLVVTTGDSILTYMWTIPLYVIHLFLLILLCCYENNHMDIPCCWHWRSLQILSYDLSWWLAYSTHDSQISSTTKPRNCVHVCNLCIIISVMQVSFSPGENYCGCPHSNFLPSPGRGKVFTTLPKLHLKDYTGFLFVVVVHIQSSYLFHVGVRSAYTVHFPNSTCGIILGLLLLSTFKLQNFIWISVFLFFNFLLVLGI